MVDRERITPANQVPQNAARGDASDRRLARLDELDDYEIADGEPDIRGWDVKAAGDRKIGTVHDLIVDTVALEVRYMDVELDRSIGGERDDDRHVLMPIGSARLDDDDNIVRVPTEPTGGFGKAPRFRHAPVSVDDEHRLRDFYGNTGHDRDAAQRFYGKRRAGRDNARVITRSEEQLAVGRRPVQEGEVTVRKHVETEHVKQQVPVTHEEVTVDRRPARPGMSAKPEVRDDEIRVPVMGEEIVVEKRAVPKEEIVIERHAKRDEKTVEADLKRERVDVDRTDDRERRDR